MIDKYDQYLHAGIEDIVYEWSLSAAGFERLIDNLHDYVLETYGPPF